MKRQSSNKTEHIKRYPEITTVNPFRSQCVIIVEIILRSETVDYILTICVVWLIMIGFFLVLTREVLLLLGVAFPILIIILLKNSKNNNS
jgi:uncharacterized membrane protein